jgi:hypothetical protein
MDGMEMFVVRLWTPGSEEPARSSVAPTELRGVLESPRLGERVGFRSAAELLAALRAGLEQAEGGRDRRS